ncbi:conserved hypothetical protein [Vibrio cholerae MO10]|uniref:Uncharacterized protein n=1 Tax=Vibrio cholerae (strain MO10) TaxID=345072 RepID=A0A0X1L022_VIBCO|nr:conserved hypothetical protein [Vibrio cholerae MO10]
MKKNWQFHDVFRFFLCHFSGMCGYETFMKFAFEGFTACVSRC